MSMYDFFFEINCNVAEKPMNSIRNNQKRLENRRFFLEFIK